MKKFFYNLFYTISVGIFTISAYSFCVSLFTFIINRRFLPDINKCIEGDFCTGVTYSFFEKISPLLILLAIAIISFIGVKKIPAANKKIGWIINIFLIIIFLVFFLY